MVNGTVEVVQQRRPCFRRRLNCTVQNDQQMPGGLLHSGGTGPCRAHPDQSGMVASHWEATRGQSDIETDRLGDERSQGRQLGGRGGAPWHGWQ